MPPLALAQVDTLYPDEGKVSIVFPTLSMLSGLRVRIAAPNISDNTGTFRLPRRGDWGLVAFFQNDPRTCVWLLSVPDERWNTLPVEILADDPEAAVTYTPGGTAQIEWGEQGAGDFEHGRADGTLFRISHGKDGSLSNATRRRRRTDWKVTRDKKRGGHQPPPLPPADLYLEHASGAVVSLSADGSFLFQTAAGHRFRMHDGTEKVRASDAPHGVTATPEQDAQRVSSELALTTESGLSIVLHDDPVKNTDRHLTLRTPGGHRVTLRDTPQGSRGIEAVTAGGLLVKLDDTAKKATVKGELVELDAQRVNLGTGASRAVVLDGDPVIGGTAIKASSVSIYGK